jgi:hypothetical protein
MKDNLSEINVATAVLSPIYYTDLDSFILYIYDVLNPIYNYFSIFAFFLDFFYIVKLSVIGYLILISIKN